MDCRRIFLYVAACVLLASSCTINLAGAQGVGVNYGLLGDNLPPPSEVVALFKSRNITKIRLFDPNPEALNALRDSGIEVVLGTLNQDLPQLATDLSFAVKWVNDHVAPYAASVRFRYISAGNEVIPGELAVHVPNAIQRLEDALKAANISVPVTTAIATGVLGESFPPSASVFSEQAAASLVPIVGFLASRQTPLLVNVYPYFAYASDPVNVRLDYALFTAPDVVVQDGELGYRNLFEAIVDCVYWAAEKVGAPALKLVVSETGWPSGGNATGATVDYARTYNSNALAHARNNTGTPKRPESPIETYVFATFNENQKPLGIEQNFGLYYPNKTEVYHVDF